ncbi:MAG TPA: hypothetical protein VIF84_02475 [Candidatus Limnocylindrales bacterium]
MLTRGLRYWVVEDGRSIEAAMADARRDEDRGLASAQLEAFHQTFNFCMDCRQYTCTDCWNPSEGRCQSCAPLPGAQQADLAAEHAAAAPAIGAGATNGAVSPSAWPTIDLTADQAAPEPITAPEPALLATPYVPTDLQPVDLPDDDVETMIGAADAAAISAITAEPEPEIETLAEAEPEVETLAEAEPEVETLAEAEPAVETLAAAAEIKVVAEAEPEIEVVAEAEPEVEVPAEAELEIEVVAEAEPEVEVVAAAEVALEPVAAEAEVALEPVAAAAEASPTPEPAAPVEPPPPTPRLVPGWTMVAPDAPAESPAEAPAWPPRSPVYQPPAATPPAAPASPPGQPEWPTVAPAAFAVAAPQSVWEESSLSVINRPGAGVQACVSCGLPLSATARFCRRCGTRQAA